MKAVLFGSIGTVCDTSALQLKAYNRAFVEYALDWHWSEAEYQRLLGTAGGLKRLRQYADVQHVAAPSEALLAQVHARKRTLYAEFMANADNIARPGVLRVIREARQRALRLGFVTTTDRDNIEAIASAAGDGFSLYAFDVVVDRSMVTQEKPAPQAYLHALDALDCHAVDAIAIEDTAVCVEAARAAGLRCLATPHSFSVDQDFTAASAVVSDLGSDAHAARQLAGPNVVEHNTVQLDALAKLPPVSPPGTPLSSHQR